MLDLKLKNLDLNKLDNTYIESAIFALWKIDILNLIKTKAILTKNFYMYPSEIDNMSMWEYELFLTELSKLNKEDNEAQKTEMDKYDMSKYQKMMNSNNSYKPPKMPNMKI